MCSGTFFFFHWHKATLDMHGAFASLSLMAGSLNYPYARCGLALQRHADNLAMVTVPVGVTETFLFHFFSSVSYDILGSCVHSVSSCFKENDITYPEVQEVKEYVPQTVTDQEVKLERFSSGSSLTPPANFFAYDYLLCLHSSQALLAMEHFIFLSLLFMFLIILCYISSFNQTNQNIALQKHSAVYVSLRVYFWGQIILKPGKIICEVILGRKGKNNTP